MPAPLPRDLCERIAAACRQPDAIRNQIARHFGVSPATVTKIARGTGVTFDWQTGRRERFTRQLDHLQQTQEAQCSPPV
jgi:transposase-like protein